MREESPLAQEGRPSSGLRYLWPTPTGLLLGGIGWGIQRFMGYRAFLNVHAWLELGMIAAMLASVVYAVRLGGKERRSAPRWIFVLNLAFGPLIFTACFVAGVVQLLAARR